MRHMMKTGICPSHLHQPCLIFQEPTQTHDKLLHGQIFIKYGYRWFWLFQIAVEYKVRQIERKNCTNGNLQMILVVQNVEMVVWRCNAAAAAMERKRMSRMPPRRKRVAVDGKQFGDQTPDQMKLISCKKKQSRQNYFKYFHTYI